MQENFKSGVFGYLESLEKDKENLSPKLLRLITMLREQSPEDLASAGNFLPFMILQIEDEDLKKLGEDYGKSQAVLLLAMLLFPKERWEELGIPEYLRKYEIADEEEDDW